MEAYGLSDVVIFTGVKIPVLENWIKRGWVKPGGPSAPATDAPHTFSRQDLYHIAFIKKVIDCGFSPSRAMEKINIYTLCEAGLHKDSRHPVAIAFSRTVESGELQTKGAWIISGKMDDQTGWDSLNLIGKRLGEGASDFYIINFTMLASSIDATIEAVRMG